MLADPDPDPDPDPEPARRLAPVLAGHLEATGRDHEAAELLASARATTYWRPARVSGGRERPGAAR